MWDAMLLIYPKLWDKFGAVCPTYEQMIEYGFPKKDDIKTQYFMDWLLVMNLPYKECEYDFSPEDLKEHNKIHSNEIKCLEQLFAVSLDDRLQYLTFDMIFGPDC